MGREAAVARVREIDAQIEELKTERHNLLVNMEPGSIYVETHALGTQPTSMMIRVHRPLTRGTLEWLAHTDPAILARVDRFEICDMEVKDECRK